MHEDPSVHEDIQLAIIQGHFGGECKAGGGPYISSFVDLRNEMILNWIMRKVPDVYVTGNMIYGISNMALNFLCHMML